MSPWANVRGNLQFFSSLFRCAWGAHESQRQGRLLRFLFTHKETLQHGSYCLSALLESCLVLSCHFRWLNDPVFLCSGSSTLKDSISVVQIKQRSYVV